MSGRWRWLDGHGWRWTKDPDPVQAQRVLQPVNDPPPLDGEFREHRTGSGPLWVPAGARLHDVPFGFQIRQQSESVSELDGIFKVPSWIYPVPGLAEEYPDVTVDGVSTVYPGRAGG